MEHRITSLLLSAPEAGLEASCKELDKKVTWLLHNSRKMDNYLELEPFSKELFRFFSPITKKPGQGQPTAGDGKGTAPRRTDATRTGQADFHRNGAYERLHGI